MEYAPTMLIPNNHVNHLRQKHGRICVSGAPRGAYWTETDPDGSCWLCCARRSVADGLHKKTFLLRPFPALAIEMAAVDIARHNNFAGIRVYDRSTGTVYQVSLKTMFALGKAFQHEGCTLQLRLSLSQWIRVGDEPAAVPSPAPRHAEQLMLGGMLAQVPLSPSWTSAAR